MKNEERIEKLKLKRKNYVRLANRSLRMLHSYEDKIDDIDLHIETIKMKKEDKP